MSQWETERVRLSPEEHRLLHDALKQASGFVLREDLIFLAERRLAPRLETLGLDSYAAYVRYLRHDPKGPDEVELAVDLLVPHETYFFREPQQLAAFTDELCPLVEQQNRATRMLKVWSAGCASGEEAYTVAMALLDCGRFTGWDVDVLGTDLSVKALAVARHAEYGPSAFRATTPQQLAQAFDETSPGRHAVKPKYRQVVRFGKLNLLDERGAGLLPMMDVIFCRNVLIYFDEATRRRVVDLFFERLRPGGYLLLGHSENLFSMGTRFELVHLEGDLVYRKGLPR